MTQRDSAKEMEEMQKSIGTMHRDIDQLQREQAEARRGSGGSFGRLGRALFGRRNSELWDDAKMEVRIKERQYELDKLTYEFNKRQEMEHAARVTLDAIATVTRGTRRDVAAMRPIRFKSRDNMPA
jgi:hypothetical protein